MWRAGQSYSQDFRGRVLGAVDGGTAAAEVAALFRVSLSYIYKALGRRRSCGRARRAAAEPADLEACATARGDPGRSSAPAGSDARGAAGLAAADARRRGEPRA